MRLKMKQLEELTGVGRETIRFYLREGILPEPERPKKNVAVYSEKHVGRIRLIKRLQDKRFLPLSVIKRLINEVERNSTVTSDGQSDIGRAMGALLGSLVPQHSETVESAAAAAGLTVDELRRLDDIGVIEINQDQETLDYRDIGIVELWGRARTAGFTPEAGYDADFLRNYVGLIDRLARFEAEYFLNAFGGVVAPIEASDQLISGLEIVNEILNLLHTKALLRAMEETTSN